MKKIKNAPVVYGYVPSQLDGTEHIVSVDKKLEIPTEYSWKEVMPPVRNQGNTQTCICQSLTCVLDFITNCENNTPGVCNNFSIDTLYNKRSNKPQEGMAFKDALDILKKEGLNGVKIKSYAMVGSVAAAKQAIMMFGPIVAGLPVYQDRDPYFWLDGRDYAGGHAVCLTGWNSRGFILRNSWGKNWGTDKGYITLPFNDFEKCVIEAWTLTI